MCTRYKVSISDWSYTKQQQRDASCYIWQRFCIDCRPRLHHDWVADFLQCFFPPATGTMAMENTGNHSGVLTPKRCINLIGGMLIMAPWKIKFPEYLTDSQCECVVKDYRVSGYLFEKRSRLNVFWQRLGSFQKQNVSLHPILHSTMGWTGVWGDLSCINSHKGLRSWILHLFQTMHGQRQCSKRK